MDSVIVRDGETGKALVAGTQVSVREILEWLASGGSIEALLDVHPALTREGVAAALHFAARAVDREPEYRVPDPGTGTHVIREVAVASSVESRGRTVTIDAEEYEELLDRVELLEGICEGMLDVAAGRTVSHEEAVEYLRTHISG
jgi:uncharacterized protein (DUF433 family)/predicted transcriptional regulator